VIEELMPGAFHNTERYANNRIEADHGRLKARLRPIRALKRDHTARVIIRSHALRQNVVAAGEDGFSAWPRLGRERRG
jgi:transposase-like protein